MCYVFASFTLRPIPTCFWHRFWIDFSSILAPKPFPKCFQKPFKKNIHFGIDFLYIFSVFWTILAPSWLQLGANLGHLGSILGVPRLAKIGQDRYFSILGPKVAPKSSHTPPDLDFC